MKHDIKEDGWFFDSKQGLEKDKVPGTTDGEEFRDSLNDPQGDGLKDIDVNTPQ